MCESAETKQLMKFISGSTIRPKWRSPTTLHQMLVEPILLKNPVTFWLQIHIFVILVKFGVESKGQLKIPENRQKSLISLNSMKIRDFGQIQLLAENTSGQYFRRYWLLPVTSGKILRDFAESLLYLTLELECLILKLECLILKLECQQTMRGV
ncbi:hypothetical protein OUZ56_010795 [Daphnia magna]|uniref:Uncharacterized protein n=1 Tax=Daphnia magna TaxID=35525 RepID=A0ABQ9YYP0_9CRUS|nr:hypothetical protein OUZ56_010795 [Daphnia magna]